MNQVLSSEQLKACRSSFFQSKLKYLQGASILNINDIDKTLCRTYSVKKGDFLYQDGMVCKALYIIRSGSVKSTKLNTTGLVQVVGFHLVGELIGFDGFATGYHDGAAQFLESSSVSELPLDVIDSSCKTAPTLQQKILKSMSLEINRNHELSLLLARMVGEEKLATFLLDYSSRMKQHNWKESEFNLNMARYDIASYLGLAVETTSRLFKQFHNRGLISVDGRHVKIIDMENLKRIVDVSCETDETGGLHVYRI